MKWRTLCFYRSVEQDYLPPLIIDPCRNFLGTIRTDSEDIKQRPVLVDTLEKANFLLMNNRFEFSAIFINPKISKLGGLPIVRVAILKHPGTPVYFIRDTDPTEKPEFALPKPILARLPIQTTLKKPMDYNTIQELIKPVIENFDLKAALESSKRAKPEATHSGIEEYTPILIQNFVTGRKSFFDIYVKIGKFKFIKLLKSGDPFSPTQIANYIRKGISQFYIKREAQATYLKFCDHLASQIIQMTTIPEATKRSQILNMGHETMRFLNYRCVSTEFMEHAESYLEGLNNVVLHLRLEDHPNLQFFLSDITAYEHGVATSAVSSLFIHALKIESTELQKIIGLSSLLHDIGIAKIPKDFRPSHEIESEMTDMQKTLYRSHPQMGAHILANTGKFHKAVIQAVEQHHQRRDGSGFPKRVDPTEISLSAEIVGISDELVNWVMKAKENPFINPIETLQESIENRFSLQIIDAFKKIFNPYR